MKTIKGRPSKKPSPVETLPTPEPDNNPEPQETTGAKPTPYKLQIPITDDGCIDVASMRPKTIEKLQQAIGSTPGLQGSTPAAPSGQVAVFPPVIIHTMYRTMGTLEALIATKFFHIPENISQKVFPYTPTELEALTPVTSRVLSKYAADWMIKYQDEIALGSMLSTMTVTKINAAIILAKGSQAQIVEMPKKEDEEAAPLKN
jgi:hypothetical protein